MCPARLAAGPQARAHVRCAAALHAALALATGCDRGGASNAGSVNNPKTEFNAENGPARANLTIFADSYQIYVHDCATTPVFISDWNQQTIRTKLAPQEKAFAFCPLREMDVPVTMIVQPNPPSDDFSQWDHVVECSFAAPSGRIAITPPLDPDPAAVFRVKPGSYRARVYSAGLATIDASGLNGADRYEVVIWPGVPTPLAVLKRWQDK